MMQMFSIAITRSPILTYSRASADTVVTAMERFCAAEVEFALSVTVTEKLNGLPVALVGAPAMTPVLELSAKPGGSDPVSVQLWYGGAPPEACNVTW